MSRGAGGIRAAGPGSPGGSADQPAIFFTDAAQWRAWLAANHDTATEIWMGLNAKHVMPRGLTWDEAVPEANPDGAAPKWVARAAAAAHAAGRMET